MAKIKLTVDVEGLELELISRFQDGYFDDAEDLQDELEEYVASIITNYTDVYTSKD